MEKIKVSEIGEMKKLLSLNFNDLEELSEAQLAERITDEFNVECSEEDVKLYNKTMQMLEEEDFEHQSRFVEHGIEAI